MQGTVSHLFCGRNLWDSCLQWFATVLRHMNPFLAIPHQQPTHYCRGCLLCFSESLSKCGGLKKSGTRRRGEAVYIPYVARQDIASSQMGASAADPERTQPSRSEAAFQPWFLLELWPQISSSVFLHSQDIYRQRSVHLQVSSTFFLCPRPVRTFNYWVSTTKQHWELYQPGHFNKCNLFSS